MGLTNDDMTLRRQKRVKKQKLDKKSSAITFLALTFLSSAKLFKSYFDVVKQESKWSKHFLSVSRSYILDSALRCLSKVPFNQELIKIGIDRV